jgi:DNA-binding transcriptional ArsR family regulator
MDVENFQAAAECLRTLAHPVRLRMVQLILSKELTVGELAEACDIPSHMASEHLRMMQHCGLLTRRQDGRRTYYQAAEPTLQRLMDCIENRFGAEGI